MVPAAAFMLARSRSEASMQILALVGIVLLAAVVIALAAWWLRRRTMGDAYESGPGLTLSDIRRLHRDGEMTEAEFEAAKRLIVARGLAMMSGDGPAAADGAAAGSAEDDGDAADKNPTGTGGDGPD